MACMIHRALRAALALAALAALLQVAPARAQDGQPPTATLVRVPSMGPGVRVALHRSGAPTRNVVWVTDSATVEDLAAALAVLSESRRRNGENVGGTLVARIPPGQQVAVRPAARARLQADLDRLRASGPRPLEGFGDFPAVVIALPPLVEAGP